MTRTDVQDLVAKGVDAIEHGHTYLAMICLEEAFQSDKSALVRSSLAYSRAANGRDIDEAITLARAALMEDPYNTLLCRNLGRIYLLAGKRSDALNIFRQGLVNSKDQSLIRELETMGSRKPPVFKSLRRNHPINRYIGYLLHRLGIR